MFPAALIAHFTSPAADLALDAEVSLTKVGALVFRYRLRAKGEAFSHLAPLFVPRADRAPRRTDRLWEHTCLEVFIASGSAYREFNFSPSGDWAAYDFSDYRQGRADAAVKAPPIHARIRLPFFELRADLARGDWDAFSDEMRFGVSAVVETPGGLTYWALRHTGETPDFHRRDAFLIKLADIAEAIGASD
jgi:hypothetical protein